MANRNVVRKTHGARYQRSRFVTTFPPPPPGPSTVGVTQTDSQRRTNSVAVSIVRKHFGIDTTHRAGELATTTVLIFHAP